MVGTAIVIDSEWGYRDGRRDCETAIEPIILCARKLPSCEDFSFWRLDDRLARFVGDNSDAVFVAHSATAEMKFLLRMGISLPPYWFDTLVAHRFVQNQPGRLEASLVAALNAAGLSSLIPHNKEAIRNQILNLAFGDADIPAIES